jgi:REP element-mobilizing transposase RayT
MDGYVYHSNQGRIARSIWLNIPNHCRSINLGEFSVLPDHIHGILFLRPNNINSYENKNIARKNFAAGSLSAIIRSYKSTVTKTVNEVQQTPGKKYWPRNYYDRIIWNEKNVAADPTVY